MLAVLVVVLLVARPLVRGEDPGQLSDLSDPGSMALTLLALVGCAVWAAWRLWAREAPISCGPFEAALLVLVLLHFLGSIWAPYRRAAWLTAWEWLGLVLTVFLVRQLAVRAEEQTALFGVLLATAVALAAQGAYQAFYDLPRGLVAAGPWPAEHVRDELDRRMLSPSLEEVTVLTQRLERQQVTGPYFFPASLASVLVLFLPGLAGAVVVALRQGAPTWQTGMAGLFAGLAALILVLTRAWSVVAAGLLVGLVAAGLLWSRRRGGMKVGLPLALVVGGLLGWMLSSAGLFTEAWRNASEVWPAAWRLIEERVWSGAGPSQFPLLYPRYMAETAGVPVNNPGNLFLDFWAEIGLPGVVVLLVVLIVPALALLRWWQEPEQDREEGDTPDVVRWEYYIGGMVALVLAFALRAGTLPVGELVSETVLAGLAAVVWFGAFGLYERLRTNAAERSAALGLGALALVAALFLTPGITYPAVAGLLLVVLALLLATRKPQYAVWLGRQSAVRAMAVPVLVAVAFCHFAFVFYPAAASTSAIRRARLAGGNFLLEVTRKPEDRTQRDPSRYLSTQVIDPLLTAAREEPGNVRTLVSLSVWYGRLWARSPFVQREPSYAEVAVRFAVSAQQTCPPGAYGYLAEYDLRGRIASVLRQAANQLEEEAKKDKRLDAAAKKRNSEAAANLRPRIRQQYELAAEALRKYLPHDPTDPQMRYLLASALFEAGKTAEAREEASEARYLDGQARPPRTLSDPQRDQVKRWLEGESAR